VLRQARALWERYGLPDWIGLDHHDHLQAVVAALSAAALLGGPCLAIPRGEAAHVLAASAVPAYVVEGLIWDAKPLAGAVVAVARGGVAAAMVTDPDVFVEARDYDNRLLPDDRDCASEQILKRGVALFRELARRANAGEAVGIGYAQFACLLHGVRTFAEVTGKQFLPSDSSFVVRLAREVTRAAGGRIAVSRAGTTIQAGMDTFVWNVSPPYDRPAKAWLSRWGPLPYTRDEWRRVFPDGARRLHR
jgi:hypothetical protein